MYNKINFGVISRQTKGTKTVASLSIKKECVDLAESHWEPRKEGKKERRWKSER